EIVLPITTLSGVVLVLIVKVELHNSSYGELAAHVEICCAPFAVLTLVERFGCNIGNEVVGGNRDGSLRSQSIPVAPRKGAILPIKICAVSVGQQNSRHNRKVEGHGS